MAGGAPKGNQNAAKPRLWDGAIRRGLAKDRERLHRIAEQVLQAAEKGEPWAITEVRNTLDGKPREFKEIHKVVERRLSYAERLEKEAAAAAARSTEKPMEDTVQ